MRSGFVAAAACTALCNAAFAHSFDLTKLPLGDGKYSYSTPQQNYIYACSNPATGGGSNVAGPWIGTTTYDLTQKVTVAGSVSWPNASFSLTAGTTNWSLAGNDLPVGGAYTTGIFPIARGSAAYTYDQNPNSILAQSLNLSLPLHPSVAAKPTCLSGGKIGIMLNGVELFDALDAVGRDGGAHEIQDSCSGHPETTGSYHYHTISSCMNIGSASGSSPQLGIAMDGLGLYGPYENGQYLANVDLDVCHGRVSAVTYNGVTQTMYHYVANYEYPYTIGCYRGTPVGVQMTPSASLVIVPESGWWWNANEGGRGYSIEVTSAGHLFMAAYMYRSDGTAVWYSGTATSTSNTYSFPLSEYTGTETLSGSSNVVGTTTNPANVTLTFTGLESGMISWSGGAFGSSSVTTPITRYPFYDTSQVVSPSLTANPQTGWWWNSAEAGTGYFIEQQGSMIFVATYLYGADQRDVWYYAQGTAAATGSGGLTMSATLSQAANGQTLTSGVQSINSSTIGTIALNCSSNTSCILTLPDARQVALSRFSSF